MKKAARATVRDAYAMWRDFWKSRDDESTDGDAEERACIEQISQALRERVEVVGRVETIASMCAEAAESGALAAMTIALVFVWRDFDRRDWLAVAERVVSDRQALYQCLWLLHDLLDVDPLEFLLEAHVLTEARARALRPVAPKVIPLGGQKEAAWESSLRLHGVDLQRVRDRARLRA